MIFVNFKIYPEGTGIRALNLVKVIEEIVSASSIKVIPVVQAVDVREIAVASKLEIWVQKIDPAEYGAHTGAILAEAVWEDGALGTFLNHSEAKFSSIESLKLANDRALAVGLKTLVFASTLDELRSVCSLKPTFVAYEPPEFIGCPTTSVAKEQPEIISRAVETAKAFDLPLIVGAGIKSAEDVRKSLELGAVGVAVASDIVKAEDPKKELADLVEGFE